MKLLDTSIFIYAQGRPHAYREACMTLVSRLGETSADFTIDIELLQEILHVYTVRSERLLAVRTFDRLLTLFPNPIVIQTQEMAAARGLLEGHLGLSARDAIHTAVVFTQGLEGIVTTDRVFREVRGLTTFDPIELASRP